MAAIAETKLYTISGVSKGMKKKISPMIRPIKTGFVSTFLTAIVRLSWVMTKTPYVHWKIFKSATKEIHKKQLHRRTWLKQAEFR